MLVLAREKKGKLPASAARGGGGKCGGRTSAMVWGGGGPPKKDPLGRFDKRGVVALVLPLGSLI